MSEIDERRLVVAEALDWIGTPYVSGAMVKGTYGGTDCAMFPLAVYRCLGYIPTDYDPRPYSAQWHIHQDEEKYLTHILKFAKEVPAPPERLPLPGDFVLFKIARVMAHGAIIIDWPIVVHAIGQATVMPEDISKNLIGKRALWLVPQRFFSVWS